MVLYAESYDPAIADAALRLGLNGLPAAVSRDHFARQYITDPDGRVAGLAEKFGNVHEDATVYGLETNFPCCTVNFPQGWLKLLAGAWLRDDRSAAPVDAPFRQRFICALLVPSILR